MFRKSCAPVVCGALLVACSGPEPGATVATAQPGLTATSTPTSVGGSNTPWPSIDPTTADPAMRAFPWDALAVGVLGLLAAVVIVVGTVRAVSTTGTRRTWWVLFTAGSSVLLLAAGLLLRV
ncbi:hypothetical protein FHS29_007210 [Saccharothrix tamanrassetensis]|uniref:Uncharacterized protein n=1 Tax=Saccharothrix tamanrassetensis TaxID=1051531 RepID=A0A841CQ95_9PSEU|nr:hypothetical protein [Saccharothrix tamanrassetensis]MBB5960582.1 hypothetical protein [Saccharothrix tamanrassetensis]